MFEEVAKVLVVERVEEPDASVGELGKTSLRNELTDPFILQWVSIFESFTDGRLWGHLEPGKETWEPGGRTTGSWQESNGSNLITETMVERTTTSRGTQAISTALLVGFADAYNFRR